MNITWVLVADNSCAKLFARTRNSLQFLEQIDNAQGRMHEGDLNTDMRGRVYGSCHVGTRNLAPNRSTRNHLNTLYAGELCSQLNKAYDRGEFMELYIFAPPAMMGAIRTSMSENLAAVVARQFTKNLIHSTSETIMAKMCA